MIDGKVHSGTDGSAKPLKASHSWIQQSSRSGDFMSFHATKKHTLQISITHLSDRKRLDMQQLSLLHKKFYKDNPLSTKP